MENEMHERGRDDTTETPEHARAGAPRDYYDDDGTGYEVYDPEEDDEETDDGSGKS